MTYEQIDAFISVVEQGSFTKAADSLYLTPTALSHRISNLEEELTFRLFLRNRGIQQVALTTEGAKFFPIATQIQKLWLQALNLKASTPSLAQQTIRVSFSFSLYDSLAPIILPLLSSADFRSHIICLDTKNAMHALEYDEIDFAFCAGNVSINEEHYLISQLAIDPIVVITCSDNLGKKSVSIKDLNPDKEIFSYLGETFLAWHCKMLHEPLAHSNSYKNIHYIKEVLTQQPDSWSFIPSRDAKYCSDDSRYKILSVKEKIPAQNITLLSKIPLITQCHELLLQAVFEHEDLFKV